MIEIDKFVEVMAGAGVEYILIGGMAARVHGSAQVTQDVDVVYSRSDANVTRLVSALATFEPYPRGAPPGLPFEWSVKTVKAGLNFTLTTTMGAIDILGEVAGGGRYEDLVAHAVTEAAFGHKIQLVSLPWLIRLKRAAGRPRDFNAIAELELLQSLASRTRAKT